MQTSMPTSIPPSALPRYRPRHPYAVCTNADGGDEVCVCVWRLQLARRKDGCVRMFQCLANEIMLPGRRRARRLLARTKGLIKQHFIHPSIHPSTARISPSLAQMLGALFMNEHTLVRKKAKPSLPSVQQSIQSNVSVFGPGALNI